MLLILGLAALGLTEQSNNHRLKKATGIRPAIEDVEKFHKCIQHLDSCVMNQDEPFAPALIRRHMRFDLLMEEVEELRHAIENNDIEEVADAYADIIYIVLGSAYMQIGKERFIRVWEEVQRSNMAKFPNGQVTKRKDGKILKPKNWKPPNIRKAFDGDLP